MGVAEEGLKVPLESHILMSLHMWMSADIPAFFGGGLQRIRDCQKAPDGTCIPSDGLDPLEEEYDPYAQDPRMKTRYTPAEPGVGWLGGSWNKSWNAGSWVSVQVFAFES